MRTWSARGSELFEYGESLLPGLLGCVGLAFGSVGVPKLEEDVGFGAPVSDLAKDCLCLLVVVNGIDGASVVMAGFGEFLEGVWVLPSVASLLEGGYCRLAQADGGLEGSEALVDGTEPRLPVRNQRHRRGALRPEITSSRTRRGR